MLDAWYGLHESVGSELWPITWRSDYLGIDRSIYPMSATIRWKYLATNDPVLPVSAPTAFIGAMERAFGPSPWKLTSDHRSKLEGMAAAYGTQKDNPYDVLIEKLNRNEGGIEVWSDY